MHTVHVILHRAVVALSLFPPPPSVRFFAATLLSSSFVNVSSCVPNLSCVCVEKVTPFELEVALGHREWNGFYSTDFADVPNLAFSKISTKGSNATDRGQDLDDTGEDRDQPFFSLVSGTYKTVSAVPKNAGIGMGPEAGAALCRDGQNSGSDAGGALVGVGERSLVEWSSPAADFLGRREFQGLEALVGETEAKPAVEGQSGIASDYTGV